MAVVTALDGRPVAGEVGDARGAPAQSRRALHHLHAAAGRQPEAPLLRQEDHDARPAALRRHRAGRRGAGGPHHLHAHRRGARGRRGAGGGARVGRAAAGARVSPRQPAHLQVEEERAGRARGHPPLRGGPGAQGPRRAPDQGPARAVPDHLGALPRQPDAARGVRHRGRGHHRGRLPLPRPGLDAQVRRLHRGVRGVARGIRGAGGGGAGGGGAAAGGGRDARRCSRWTPSSTSPSRRRATPRPRW